MVGAVPAATQATDPHQLFAELVAKVDAHFGRVASRYGDAMSCRSGCAECCVRFSVTLIEAVVIGELLAAMSGDERRTLAAAAAAAGNACAALAADGRCHIYSARPLVCRSHGAPIRLATADSTEVEVCHLNFTELDLAAIDDDCVIDQNTLSTVLAAIDSGFADQCGAPRGERIDLADLLINSDHYFELRT